MTEVTVMGQPASEPADTTVRKIAALLARVLTKDPDTITEDARLFGDLGLDSTTILELLMDLESELGAQFDVDTLEERHFQTVGTLAAYVSISVPE